VVPAAPCQFCFSRQGHHPFLIVAVSRRREGRDHRQSVPLACSMEDLNPGSAVSPTALAGQSLRWGQEGCSGGEGVILLLCGSFNPVTRAHLELVAHGAAAVPGGGAGPSCAGSVLSPVHDAYGKPGLAPGAERVAMCRLAVEGGGGAVASVPVAVDAWEASRDGYSTTVDVLRRVRDVANAALEGERARRISAGADGRAGLFDRFRVMLLCGEDLLASFLNPGVWVEAHVREILSDAFGVVCVARSGEGAEAEADGKGGSASGLGRLERLVQENALLRQSASHVRCVPGGGPTLDGVSSTRVRGMLRQLGPGADLPESLLDLVEPAVARHALAHGLYAAA